MCEGLLNKITIDVSKLPPPEKPNDIITFKSYHVVCGEYTFKGTRAEYNEHRKKLDDIRYKWMFGWYLYGK